MRGRLGGDGDAESRHKLALTLVASESNKKKFQVCWSAAMSCIPCSVLLCSMIAVCLIRLFWKCKYCIEYLGARVCTV